MKENPEPLEFHVISSKKAASANTKKWTAYLALDNWDDWGKYRTQFYLTLVDPQGNTHNIGQVKIGERGLKPHAASKDLPEGHRSPGIDSLFENLGEEFFSIGQDEDYYGNLNLLGDTVREQVLVALRDMAWDADLWESVQDEYVLGESLLRSVTYSTVEGQFRRMARGDSRVTSYDFSYSPPKRLGDGEPPFELEFNVNPESPVPTNVHVLIGRNGVGKTRLLSLMTKALVAKDASAKQSGRFKLSEQGENSGDFANVVSVSFSAFDEAELIPDRGSSPDALGFSFIGLRGWTSDSPTASIKPKSPHMLATEFCNSLKECRIGKRRGLWTEAIRTLQSDPVFKSAQVADMIDTDLSDKEELDDLLKTFKKLSSGHKIVLLTLTRLVEKVEERTLVLIDEPEGHLHPPLLSAMTRAVSELLVKRNGVAIVATHSPIILQEVPKSCVWIINRVRSVASADRPSIETFGESIGILSREVFQLELSQSGYHKILNDIRRAAESYDDAIEHLGGHIGAEGKAILRAMYLEDEI